MPFINPTLHQIDYCFLFWHIGLNYWSRNSCSRGPWAILIIWKNILSQIYSRSIFWMHTASCNTHVPGAVWISNNDLGAYLTWNSLVLFCFAFVFVFVFLGCFVSFCFVCLFVCLFCFCPKAKKYGNTCIKCMFQYCSSFLRSSISAELLFLKHFALFCFWKSFQSKDITQWIYHMIFQGIRVLYININSVIDIFIKILITLKWENG